MGNRSWTATEDKMLEETLLEAAPKRYTHGDEAVWQEVLAVLPGRTLAGCRARWQRITRARRAQQAPTSTCACAGQLHALETRVAQLEARVHELCAWMNS